MTRADPPTPPIVADRFALTERVRAADGLLIGLDFDGTLAPIVVDPDEATIDPAAVDPLERLVDLDAVTVAVLSGRALDDLADRIPVCGVTLGGNHGLACQRDGERGAVPAAEAARAEIDRLAQRLAVVLEPVPGCRIEDKGLTLSVHVRETPPDRVDDVRAVVENAVATGDDLRLVEGKEVYEIRPAVDHDKGTAMERLSADVPVDWLTVYVGDDTTDEDAFRAIQPEGVGVHVGTTDETAAAATLPDQTAVPRFLQWLAAVAPASKSAEGRRH